MNIDGILKEYLKGLIDQRVHLEGDIWLVPCIANYSENIFKPLAKPIAFNFIPDEITNKQGWTSIEDEILLKIVLSRGEKS